MYGYDYRIDSQSNRYDPKTILGLQSQLQLATLTAKLTANKPVHRKSTKSIKTNRQPKSQTQVQKDQDTMLTHCKGM